MLNDLVPIAICSLIFLFANNLVNTRHRKQIIKLLVENNLVNNNEFSFKFIDEQKKNYNSIFLAIALGTMGLALGSIVSLLVRISLQNIPEHINAYKIETLIYGAPPLFFASIGVLISYFIIRSDKSDKSTPSK